MKRATLRPRIAVPGLLLTLLVALLAAASCAESVVTDGVCEDGLTTCAGACVDTASDPANCGLCDNACPTGGACQEGACVAQCGSGLTNCNGSCADIQNDPAHCGACGLACPDGLPCVEGACQAGCPDGLSACSGGSGTLCVDLMSDTGHCGDCEVACTGTDACVGGVCGACEGGLTNCNGICVDTQTSSQNCGGCGLSCAQGFACVGGDCQNPCDPGEAYCNGGCVDTQTSQQHCGFCNNACGGNQICTAGACVCPSGGVCGLCGVTDLGSMVPQTASGSTLGALDAYAPNCSGPGSGEAAYSFTAPADGSYVFNTQGSSYDTVLAVLDPSCGELVCNDDSPSGGSKVSVNLAQNQTVIVVVDGYFGDEGFYNLNVLPGPIPVCPTADIGSTVPQSVFGTTLNAGDALTASCNFGSNPDASYTFTAPADGTYAFDTFGSFYNTVLHVRDGGCAGPELACNDDANWNAESKVTLTLTAGQTVVIGVEGASGEEIDFQLNVNTAQPPVCPTGSLGSSVPVSVTGSTAGHGDAVTASCNFFPSADDSYTFTAPTTDVFSFDTAGSLFNTVVSIRDGLCSGPELACNDDTPSSAQARQLVSLTAGQTVVVSVEGAGGEEGSYTLQVDTYVPPPCPLGSLASSVPQTVNGDTTGLNDYLTPNCGSPGGPEYTYSFTAPASANYTFDTFGSLFDTILHVHSASCLGAELVCNDDAGAGVQSEVSLFLTAGQTVIVVVDGYGGDFGPYTLNVN